MNNLFTLTVKICFMLVKLYSAIYFPVLYVLALVFSSHNACWGHIALATCLPVLLWTAYSFNAVIYMFPHRIKSKKLKSFCRMFVQYELIVYIIIFVLCAHSLWNEETLEIWGISNAHWLEFAINMLLGIAEFFLLIKHEFIMVAFGISRKVYKRIMLPICVLNGLAFLWTMFFIFGFC